MSIAKDYQSELRRFISGQHLNTGVRVTASVIIPAWILYHYGMLTSMVSFPLGALFVGLTDNPGPVHHRRNGMAVSTLLNFLVVLIAGFTRSSPILTGVEIVIFGMLFSIISIYGQRASSIGLTALIIFILNTNTLLQQAGVWQTAFFYMAGGAWYMLVSLSLSSLRPYRPLQQLLGECLMKTSSYLSTRGLFYNKDADELKIVGELIEQQIEIHHFQEQLRSMLFTTRRFISESTHKGRILTMMFRDSLDLFEKAVGTHHNYRILHQQFGDTGILQVFGKHISSLALILYNIGLAIQEGSIYKDEATLKALLDESNEAFDRLRKKELNSGNAESFLKLKQVLYSLQNISERIRKLMLYTTYEKALASDFKTDVDFSKFPTRQTINFNLFVSNLSLRSSAFRHAVRLTLALLAGYIISLFFEIGHGYWILLTIATIIKPAYSLSKQRNVQRLAGTFVGVLIGFAILYFSNNNTVIFVSMIATMIISYSLLRVNYAVSIGGITVYLLLSFHFLYPQGLTTLLFDRIVDTLIGCLIAYIVSYFVLPSWEYQQIDQLAEVSIEKQKQYFNTVVAVFSGAPASPMLYKIARKEAFVSLANLSDSFQRMLSDPKIHQPGMPLYHQLVSSVHMLISYIASLPDYAQQYSNAGIRPVVDTINKTFDHFFDDEEMKDEDIEPCPDQFRLILSTIKEVVKIGREIKEKRD